MNKLIIKKIIKNITRKKIKIKVIKIDEKKMLLINKKYKKKYRTTDVLSFKYINNYEKKKYIGEIFICYKIIKKKSQKYKKNIIKQLYNTIIHGILHLLGYKHETKKNYMIMLNLEKKILKYIFKNI